MRVLLRSEDLGVMQISDAYMLAVDGDLDLVEEDPDADPPVVRICDSGKATYERRARAREVVREARRITRDPDVGGPPPT